MTFLLPAADGVADEVARRLPQATIVRYEEELAGIIASRLGLRTGARAVGRANGSNPIAIVVPCHRVVGATGARTGYGGTPSSPSHAVSCSDELT